MSPTTQVCPLLSEWSICPFSHYRGPCRVHPNFWRTQPAHCALPDIGCAGNYELIHGKQITTTTHLNPGTVSRWWGELPTKGCQSHTTAPQNEVWNLTFVTIFFQGKSWKTLPGNSFFYIQSFYHSKNCNRGISMCNCTWRTHINSNNIQPNTTVKALFPFFLCHPITITESHTGKPDPVIVLVMKEASSMQRMRDPSAAACSQPSPALPRICAGLGAGGEGRGTLQHWVSPIPALHLQPFAGWQHGQSAILAAMPASPGGLAGRRWLGCCSVRGGKICFRKPMLQQHVKGNFSCMRKSGDLVHQTSLPLPWAWPAPMTSLDPLQDYYDCYLCLFQLTRTSCCGKGPLEFSGTLIGGMTQSLFCLRRPFALWCWRQGSRVSLCCCARSTGPLFLPFGCFGSKKANPVSFCLIS